MAKDEKTILDAEDTILDSEETVLDTEAADATLHDDDAAMPDDAAVLDSEEDSDDGNGIPVIEKGASLLGTYRIESDAIEGGMGAVCRVHHTGWNVDLAMKRPKASLFQSKKQKEDFVHECEAWINLGLHPHIVSCYYVRDIAGVPSIFSEWMDGGSLKNAIEDGSLYGGNAEERILDLSIQFARGLHYAHKQGLVHQDVKPDNLLLTKNWDAKVADFGIARARTMLIVPDADMTADDSMVAACCAGTPAYRSVEQQNKKKLTLRTDIFSWAVSVMEMYLGDRPWQNGVIAGAACEEEYFPKAKVPIPKKMQELLKECFRTEEAQRPHDFAVVEQRMLLIYKHVTGKEYGRILPKMAVDIADNLNNRALSFLDLDKPEEAEKCWNQALQFNPNHSDSVYNHAVYLWHCGRISGERALSFVRMDFENHMGSPHAALLLGKVSMEFGDTYNALGCFARALCEPEAETLTKKIMSPGYEYSCDFVLSKIVDYQAYAQLTKKYEQAESDIRKLLESGNMDEAFLQLNITSYDKELEGFGASPQRIRLSEELGRYGYIFWVAATWPVRQICQGNHSHIGFNKSGNGIFVDSTLYSLETGENLGQYESVAENPCSKSYSDDLYSKNGAINKAVMTYDGKYIFAMDNTSVKQWDAAENRVIKIFEGQTEIRDFCINTHYDRLVLACGKDGIVSFDVKTGQKHVHRDMKYERNPYSGCVCFMPNDQYILSGSDDILMFWNIDDNRIMGIIPCESTITLMDISADGKYIAVLTDIGAELWRCDYNYKFPGWQDLHDSLGHVQPYMEKFLMQHADYTDDDFRSILLPSLQKRGFGWIKPDSIKNGLEKLKIQMKKAGQRDQHEPAGVPAAAMPAHGFKISSGLLFGYSAGAADIVIPDGVITIGRRVFEGDRTLCSVKLPEGVTVISERAFQDCVNLVDISLPQSLKKIGSRAFAGCVSLSGVSLPDGVSIDEGAFD